MYGQDSRNFCLLRVFFILLFLDNALFSWVSPSFASCPVIWSVVVEIKSALLLSWVIKLWFELNSDTCSNSRVTRILHVLRHLLKGACHLGIHYRFLLSVARVIFFMAGTCHSFYVERNVYRNNIKKHHKVSYYDWKMWHVPVLLFMMLGTCHLESFWVETLVSLNVIFSLNHSFSHCDFLWCSNYMYVVCIYLYTVVDPVCNYCTAAIYLWNEDSFSAWQNVQ